MPLSLSALHEQIGYWCESGSQVAVLICLSSLKEYKIELLLCLSLTQRLKRETINFIELGQVFFHLAMNLKYVLLKWQSRRITFVLSGDYFGDK